MVHLCSRTYSLTLTEKGHLSYMNSIAPDIAIIVQIIQDNIFSFAPNIYLGTNWNCLDEEIPMRCFFQSKSIDTAKY